MRFAIGSGAGERAMVTNSKARDISVQFGAIQGWPEIMMKESKKAIHYIYILFHRYYVHIMSLI